MSTFALPQQLSRKARLVLFAAFSVVDDTGEVMPEGSPPSSITTLRRLTGTDRWSILEALAELEAFDLCARWRVFYIGRTQPVNATRVRIHLEGLRLRDACEACGSPSRGTGRWCARCKQVLGRDDRAWQIRALEMHDQGVSPRRIAVLLDRPLWKGSADDGRDANGGAVVPYLLSKGALGAEWGERLRLALSGGGDD